MNTEVFIRHQATGRRYQMNMMLIDNPITGFAKASIS